MNEYIAGGISGLVEVLLTHPLDYVKTKHQLYTQKNNKNNINFYKYLYRKNKIVDYYTGISSRIVGVVPMRLLFWGTQNKVKSILNDKKIDKWYNFLIIGSTSGTIQTCVDNQIEIIKTSLIEKKEVKIKNLLKFNGFFPTLYRNVIFVNILSSVCHNFKFRNNREKFQYSSMAGLGGSIISQPFDYVKTIKQSQESNIYYKDHNIKKFNTFKIINIILRDNPKILFTGWELRGSLSFFSMGIGFTVFSSLLKDN
tara:strand:+ start:703 stop:1467 length:765 start_codon:yes stop_codon:yes gene_type:complete